jgi:hypothetical protein
MLYRDSQKSIGSDHEANGHVVQRWPRFGSKFSGYTVGNALSEPQRPWGAARENENGCERESRPAASPFILPARSTPAASASVAALPSGQGHGRCQSNITVAVAIEMGFVSDLF